MNRRLIIFGLALLAVVGFSFWLFGYLTTGKLEIETSSKDLAITLIKPGDSKFSRTATGQLSETLHSGTYVAIVAGNSVGASQKIQVKGHHTTRLAIKPGTPLAVEPVIDTSSSSLSASDSELIYLNNQVGLLHRLDVHGNVTIYDPSHQFQSVKWASPSLGVGMDSSGHLFSINKGVVQPISVPTSTAAAYDVAHDGTIFYSNKFTVYKGSSSGGFSAFYTSKKPFSAIVSAPDRVAIINTPSEQGGDPYVNVVDSQGGSNSKALQANTSSSWSPDGQYLAVVSGSGSMILNPNLSKISDIPNSSIGALVWIDNNRLLYSVNDQLWNYSLNSARSDLIANMPLGLSITSLSVSDDSAYVYLTLAGSSGAQPSIKRVGIESQVISDTVSKLQSILPQTNNQYSLSLVNFGQPVVYVRSNGDTPPANFVSQVQTMLRDQGFDTSQFTIKALTVGF